MSKEIEEFYKQYYARITEIDDTPLFATGTFGEFRMLTIEEYEKLVRENKILAKALELACEGVKYFEEMQDREMGHFEFFGYDNEYDLQAIIEQYKQQAKEMLENE